MRLLLPLMALCLTLTACSEKTEGYLLPALPEMKRRATVVKTIEVARFALPTYAEDAQISLLNADGVVRPLGGSFWADTPDRALAEMLSEGLDKSLSAQVVSEPWPFNSDPDVKVEIRVRDLIAAEAGMLNFTGQYALSSPAGGSLQMLGRFDYDVPLQNTELQTVSGAVSQAMRSLTDEIARKVAQIRRSQIAY